MKARRLERATGISSSSLALGAAGDTAFSGGGGSSASSRATAAAEMFGEAAYDYANIPSLSREQTSRARGFLGRFQRFDNDFANGSSSSAATTASGKVGGSPVSATVGSVVSPTDGAEGGQFNARQAETARLSFNFVVTPEALKAEKGEGATIEANFQNGRLRLDHIKPDVLAGLRSGKFHMLPSKIVADVLPSWQCGYRVSIPLKARSDEPGASTEHGYLTQPIPLTQLKRNYGVAQVELLNRKADNNQLLMIQNFAGHLGKNLANGMGVVEHSNVAYVQEVSPIYHYYVNEINPETMKRANPLLGPDADGNVRMPIATANKFFEIAKDKLQEDLPLLNLDAFSLKISPEGETNVAGQYVPGSFVNKALLFPKNDAPANWEKSLLLRFNGSVEIQFLPVGIEIPK